MLNASYRLWSSPPPAEPRCFPPSSHSSWGTQGAGAGLESQAGQELLSMDGLAAERARRSARGVRGAGSKRQVAAAGRARGAGCRCGRRPAGGARGAARRGARGARAAGAVWGQLGGLEAARGARPRVARPSPRPLRPRPCHLLRSQGNGPGVVAVGTEREATQGRAAAPRRVAGA